MTEQTELFQGPKCRKCGARIRFIASATSGKAIPCEVEKTTVVLASGETVSGYESHFAHCPGADDMRRPKPERRPDPRMIDMIDEGLGDFIHRHDRREDDS